MGLSDLRILKPSNSPHPQGRGIRRTQDWAAFMGPHQSLSSLFNSFYRSREIFLLSGSRAAWLLIYLPICWLSHRCNSESRALRPSPFQFKCPSLQKSKALSLLFCCTIPPLKTKCCWLNLGEKKEALARVGKKPQLVYIIPPHL